MQNNSIIEFNNVSFSYRGAGGRPALSGIDFEIRRGEFLAVLGFNGSGKSTFAKHMNGILTPTEGEVRVEGMDTRDENSLFDIRRAVGMVFQNPDNQIVATVVEEDVAFALENLGIEPDEIRRRVDSSLAAVGMTKHAKDAPHRLSGGQKQRVAIAGIIAMRPNCIVLDEPTAMLDPKGRSIVMDNILRLKRELGITVVLITHYMEEAALADRIAVMAAGKIAMTGTPAEVFSNPERVRELGLDLPAVTELCRRLYEEGIDIAPNIVSPDRCVEQLAVLLEGAV